MKLSLSFFEQLVEAASAAPSADNMQPWKFQFTEDHIRVFYERARALPTDTLDMFGYISIGAAIQNMVIKAESLGFVTKITYLSSEETRDTFAKLEFESENTSNELASFIPLRKTNRSPFNITQKIDPYSLDILRESISKFDISFQFTCNKEHFSKIANLDAHSSYIRLEYRPFHDELFEILRFSKTENEKFRYGLTFESLEVPRFAVSFARFLKFHAFNDLVSKLGFGKLVAYSLSKKIKKAGCLCLISCDFQNSQSYIEAGRALEQFWLSCTKLGISVQPYGVLPQYLTKLKVEPFFFKEKYIEILHGHQTQISEIFSDFKIKSPAILLRLGYTEQESTRCSIRLKNGIIV
jgi:hypothetical protein